MEGIWSSRKRGPLANVAFTGFAHLLQVIKTGLKKIQYQPALIDGCLGNSVAWAVACDIGDGPRHVVRGA